MVQLRVFRLPCHRFPCLVVIILATTVWLTWYAYQHERQEQQLQEEEQLQEQQQQSQEQQQHHHHHHDHRQEEWEISSNLSQVTSVPVKSKEIAEVMLKSELKNGSSSSSSSSSTSSSVGGKDLEVMTRLAERRALVNEMCKRKKDLFCVFKAKLKYRDYYFYEYNTSLCSIPKAASSTWRIHLRQVNNGPPLNMPIFEDEVREAFRNRPIEDVIRDVNASNKIITVRHPFTRLVSAYRNKFNDGKPMPANRPVFEKKKHERLAGSYWDDRFYQFWLPAVFVNGMVPADTHLKVGLQEPIDPTVRYSTWVYERLRKILKPRISFTQFLRFVIHTFQNNNPDAHWSRYNSACCPCHFDYQYITKVETMSEDLEYVFKKLGIPANPNLSKNQHRKNVDEIYEDYRYYRWVPIELKTKIYKIFKEDMDIFGYQVPQNFLKE